ncbi:MAG: hypothetical protein ACYS0I_13455 [Planctomycetota bacterium]
MRNWICSLLTCLVFFAGCAAFEAYTATTKVISDPPGARIELDDDYIGDAPLEIIWDERLMMERTFERKHTITALPIYGGQQVQLKFFWPGDSIPKTILFDMSLVPVPQRYELDIR